MIDPEGTSIVAAVTVFFSWLASAQQTMMNENENST
jgi:hypothetical protein